jgi:hypothetical protein
VVDFAFLSKNAPQPFKREWSGGGGINVHHKFVVTNFNLPTAKVFTGSSNLSPSGETGNGDHLFMIADRRVATSYAIEALRVVDHLHFRVRMEEAGVAPPQSAPLPPVRAATPVGAAAIGGGAPAAAPAAPATEAQVREKLTLKKPKAISGKDAWFERYYVAGSQREGDRKLFSK